MRRSKKLLIFMSLLMSSFVLLAWSFVQSELMGDLVSKRVSRFLNKKHQIELKFSHLEFGIFPLQTQIKKVIVSSKDVSADLDAVSVSFGLFDLFSRDLSIGKIEIRDGFIDLNEKLFSQKKGGEFKLDHLYEDLNSFFTKKLPFKVGAVTANSIILQVGEQNSVLDKFLISRNRRSYSVQLATSLKKELYTNFLPPKMKKLDVDGVTIEAQLSRSEVNVQKALLHHKNDYFVLSGKYTKDGDVRGGQVGANLSIDEISKMFFEKKHRDLLGNIKGNLSFTFAVSRVNEKLQVKGGVSVRNFRSRQIDIKKFNTNVTLDDDLVNVSDAFILVDKGSLALKSPVDIVSLKDDEPKILEKIELNLRAEKVFSNKLLKFLPELNIFDFYASGELKVTLDKKSISIVPLDDLYAEGISLGQEELKRPLFDIEYMYLKKNSLIRYVWKKDVFLNLFVKIDQTKLHTKGHIRKRGIDLKVDKAFVNFDEVGKVSGKEISGSGPVEGYVRGPFKDIVFNFDFKKHKNLKLLGFHLGEAQTNVQYHLKKNRLLVNKLDGINNSLVYSGNAYFNFVKNEHFNVDLTIEESSLTDLRRAMPPVFSTLEDKINRFDIKSNVTGKVSVSGPYKFDDLKVDGQFNAERVLFLGEGIDELKGDLSLQDKKITFTDIKGKKASGVIEASFAYDMNDDSFQYKCSVEKMRIRDIRLYRVSRLGFDGILNANVSGVGDKTNFSSKNSLRVEESKIDNVRLEDSFLTINNNNKDIFFNGLFVNGEVKAEGYVNLSDTDKKRSKIALNVDTDKVKKYFGILSIHNMLKTNLSGSLGLSAKADFDYSNFNDLNLSVDLDRLNFVYNNINVKKDSRPYSFVIDNGTVKAWDFALAGQNFNFVTKGSGQLGEDFKVDSIVDTSSAFFELVSDKIEYSDGDLKGHLLLQQNNEILEKSAEIDGSNISMRLANIKGQFTEGSFHSVLKDKIFTIDVLKGRYGNGRVRSRGFVELKFPFPRVALEGKLDNLPIPIMNKSNIVIDGKVSFSGEEIPYLLSGDIAILNGSIVENMEDIAASAISGESYKKFLPIGFIEGGVSFLSLNLNTKTKSPVVVKNGMIDIGLGGEVKISGSFNDPLFNGVLSIGSRESKFVFKGHEFFLNEGEIRLLDSNRKEKPEVSFTGVAKINDYNIFVGVSGAADNLSIEMESSPSLAQGDILSLLTLGVTSDLSRQLGEDEMRSVTNLSIGSLIVDQLKINQSLNESLGLRVSVQPEFQQNQESLLGGRTEDSGNVSQLRSTTKVQVHKKISKKVDMSISSTLGGSVDQTQKMNVNYRIDKNLSLEGIYQVQSTEEIDAETPDSIGADLKWQWSF